MMNATIITTVVNQPEFIALQRALLARFCEDQFEFVVVNDCKPKGDRTNIYDDRMHSKIEELCVAEGIRHCRIPQELHANCRAIFPNTSYEIAESAEYASHRTAIAVQWALNEIGFRVNHPVMVLDADMFPIREFSLSQMLQGCPLAGVWQDRQGGSFLWRKRVRYLWNGLFVANTDALPDKPNFSMECGRVEGLPTDTGGHLHYYFVRNPSVRVQPIHHLSSGRWGVAEEPKWLPDAVRDFVRNDIKNAHGRYYAEIYDDRFFHFRAGGNWDGMEAAQFAARQAAMIDALKRLV